MDVSPCSGLVVVECGSDWETPLVWEMLGERPLVVYQGPGETAWELSQRVVRQIDAFVCAGRTLGKAVLATGDSLSEDFVASRYGIVRALLTSGVMAPGARVMLAADERLPAAARHGLLGLAGAVLSELNGVPFQLDIRLGSVVETEGAPTSAWKAVPSA
jgi:hypothetical protein